MARLYLLALFSIISPYTYSALSDYVYPYKEFSFSNYGGVGLIQNPNSRFYKNGTLAFTWTHYEPYLRGSLVAYPFDWMEVSYQYTDINNFLYSPVKAFSGSQSLKDKSFDVKIRLLEETRRAPAVAVGARDFAGTGIFSSEFITFSKLINDIDFTLGIGWGNLTGNAVSNPLTKISDKFSKRDFDPGQGGTPSIDNYFSGDAGYFFGLEYFIPRAKGYRFKLEYDGTNYLTEGKLPLHQDSKWNFGFVIPRSQNLQFKIFYSRGNVLNFGFSYSLGLGSHQTKKTPKIPRAPLPNSSIIKKVTSKSDENLYKASLLYLQRNDINLQGATIEDNSLEIVYSQSKYRNPAISSGRVLDILDQIAPPSIKHLKVSQINGGSGMFTAEIPRNTFQSAKKYQAPELMFHELEVNAFNYPENEYIFNPVVKYPTLFSSINPNIKTQIGGPDGFFFGDFGLALKSQLLLDVNTSIFANFSISLFDNMDDLVLPSDSVLPHVRSDIVQYLRNSRGKPSIERLFFNRFGQLGDSLFYKASAGILESMFSGVGGEILYRPFHANYGFGLELWQAYQREFDLRFGVQDYKTLTGHINLYYEEPNTNVLFHIKGGRYLAKDSGITFDISRRFKSGLRIGGFFTRTDISAIEFGEGSYDKGFYFWIPLDLFSNDYFKEHFGWGLRPLTRDGGQTLNHSYPLWGVTDISSGHQFNRSKYDLLD